MGISRIIALTILIAVALSPSLPYAYVIDRIEATVGDDIITKSELDRALNAEAGRRGVTGGDAMDRLRGEALGALIDRKLILGDARRFNIVDVTREEVDAAVESVKNGYASADEFYSALAEDEMTLKELREELKDQILAVKYVDRRVRFFVRVTLDDIKTYYQENQDAFGGRGFTEVYDEIHALLVEKKTDEKLDEYIEGLKARTEITVIKQEEDNAALPLCPDKKD